MKVRRLKNGETVEINDLIRCSTCFGKQVFKVVKVTPKYCFCAYNDIARGKYPRVYIEFTFESLPRDTWNTTKYEVFRPVDKKE